MFTLERYIIDCSKSSNDMAIKALPANSVMVGGDLILEQSQIEVNGNVLERHHSSGWTISGQFTAFPLGAIVDFYAYHPLYGELQGSLNKEIECESEEAYNHFIVHHPCKIFDKANI